MLGHGRGRWEERGLGRARANPEERAGLTWRQVSDAAPGAGRLRSSGTRPGPRLQGRRGQREEPRSRGAARYGPRGPPSCQHPAWRRGSPSRLRAPLPVRPVSHFRSSAGPAGGVGRCGKRAGSGARDWAPPGAGLPPPPVPGAARSAPEAGAALRSAPATARPSAGRCPRTTAPWATGPGPGTRSAAVPASGTAPGAWRRPARRRRRRMKRRRKGCSGRGRGRGPGPFPVWFPLLSPVRFPGRFPVHFPVLTATPVPPSAGSEKRFWCRSRCGRRRARWRRSCAGCRRRGSSGPRQRKRSGTRRSWWQRRSG